MMDIVASHFQVVWLIFSIYLVFVEEGLWAVLGIRNWAEGLNFAFFVGLDAKVNKTI